MSLEGFEPSTATPRGAALPNELQRLVTMTIDSFSTELLW